MTLLRPEALPVLLLVPVVAALLWASDRARARRLDRAVGRRATALVSGWSAIRRRVRRTLFLSALVLALVAVLQPAWGESRNRIDERGVDIMVCLDVSQSMLARDVSPSRLLAARREIAALADRARCDRIGLVVFAGEAKLWVPLTRDMNSLTELLALADPLSVDRGGTDLAAALLTALDALDGLKRVSGEHEVVLLLTDGEDHEERGLRAARTCRERGITVHCVGLGSARGAKIPVRGEIGETFLRDRTGNEVVTALKPATLRRIAEATGGVFAEGGLGERPTLPTLYEERIRPMARKSLRERERRERENRYQWPLLAAFLLWIAERCVSEQKR